MLYSPNASNAVDNSNKINEISRLNIENDFINSTHRITSGPLVDGSCQS